MADTTLSKDYLTGYSEGWDNCLRVNNCLEAAWCTLPYGEWCVIQAPSNMPEDEV